MIKPDVAKGALAQKQVDANSNISLTPLSTSIQLILPKIYDIDSTYCIDLLLLRTYILRLGRLEFGPC